MEVMIKTNSSLNYYHITILLLYYYITIIINNYSWEYTWKRTLTFNRHEETRSSSLIRLRSPLSIFPVLKIRSGSLTWIKSGKSWHSLNRCTKIFRNDSRIYIQILCDIFWFVLRQNTRVTIVHHLVTPSVSTLTWIDNLLQHGIRKWMSFDLAHIRELLITESQTTYRLSITKTVHYTHRCNNWNKLTTQQIWPRAFHNISIIIIIYT